MSHVFKALCAAERFGSLPAVMAALPKYDAVRCGAALTRLERANKLSAEANEMRKLALGDIATQMCEKKTETEVLALINGARAKPAPGVDESFTIEECARRLAYNIHRLGTERTSAVAQEMAGTRLSAGAWVKVLTRLDEVLALASDGRAPWQVEA